MKKHMDASFWTATLYTGRGNEPWLLPARSREAINPLPEPEFCRLVLEEFVWLPLLNFFEDENGYNFEFSHGGRFWLRNRNYYGYDYLCERFIATIREYEQSRLEEYQ